MKLEKGASWTHRLGELVNSVDSPKTHARHRVKCARRLKKWRRRGDEAAALLTTVLLVDRARYIGGNGRVAHRAGAKERVAAGKTRAID